MPKPLPPPWDRFVPFAQKIFVWSLFFGVLWFLRSFFFLVFLTFVFGYVMQHGVEKLEHRVKSRRLRVVVVFLCLLTILVGVGWAMGPALAQQAKEFPATVKKNLGALDREIDNLRATSPSIKEFLPADLKAGDILAELFGVDGGGAKRTPQEQTEAMAEEEVTDRLTAATQGLAEATESLASMGGEATEEDTELKAATERLVSATQELALAARDRTEALKTRLDEPSDEKWRPILPLLVSVAGRSVSIGSAFLLSLLFSFLIVLDFANLARGARHLHDTRLQFIYDEVSDSLFHFGRVLGQALEAQLMIAILNTGLTSVGLAIMELPNIAFLSMVVFICSFIPVAGVFISSVPICLTALTVDGLGLAGWAIVFITLIHMIEAYVLNPKIYGAHLRMNPVLVLAILVISHHMFGMWGLVLGVPLVNFAGNYVIHGKSQRKSSSDPEPAPGGTG